MSRLAAVVVAIALTAAFAPCAAAQDVNAEVARTLKVEWERSTERRAIEGFVSNGSEYRVGLVKLRVETRDQATQAPGQLTAWVYGNIPAGGRWRWNVRLPQGSEAVGVTIESFALIQKEGVAGRESP